MIQEKTLFGNKYKFKHLHIEVLVKDEEDNVGAFSATFVHVGLAGKMSDGLMEVNRTLWDQGSSKRPKGFLVVRTVQKDDGTTTTVLVSKKWFLETLSKEERSAFEKRLDEEIGIQS